MVEKKRGAVKPAMTRAELEHFPSFLRCSTGYAEFGSGGSTLEACALAGSGYCSGMRRAAVI